MAGSRSHTLCMRRPSTALRRSRAGVKRIVRSRRWWTIPEERARHLALAASGPNEEVAALVERAAVGARARGAPDAAAELSELALRLTPPESSAVQQRRLDFATYLELVGELERAGAILEDLSETAADPDLRASALLRLSDLVVPPGG